MERHQKSNNIKNSQRINIAQITNNGKSIDDPKEIYYTFNNYFTKVGLNIDKDIPKSYNSPTSYLKHRIQHDFVIAHTFEDEILQILNNLDTNKSSGPSSIPAKLLKLAAPIIVLPLCKIINKSFSEGVFPEAIKIAKIIPTLKAGDPLDVNNHRPISLLSIFSKIIEKLVHHRLNSF